MKNIVIAIGYLIIALIFDFGIFLLDRISPSARFAAFVGRRLEGLGDRMSAMQQKLLKVPEA